MEGCSCSLYSGPSFLLFGTGLTQGFFGDRKWASRRRIPPKDYPISYSDQEPFSKMLLDILAAAMLFCWGIYDHMLSSSTEACEPVRPPVENARPSSQHALHSRSVARRVGLHKEILGSPEPPRGFLVHTPAGKILTGAPYLPTHASW